MPSKFVDDVERTRAVGRTGIIAQIEVVVLGQQLADAMQNGQPTVSAVENADRSWRLAKHRSLLQQLLYSLSDVLAYSSIQPGSHIAVCVDDEDIATLLTNLG